MIQLCVGNLNNFEITTEKQKMLQSLKAQKFHPETPLCSSLHDESEERLYFDWLIWKKAKCVIKEGWDRTQWKSIPNLLLLMRYLKSPFLGFPGGSDGKASAYSAGDLDSIPVLGRAPGEGNGNPLQYSCLENPIDGGAWWAAVHGVTKSRTRLSDFTFTFFNFSWFHVRMIAPDF